MEGFEKDSSPLFEEEEELEPRGIELYLGRVKSDRARSLVHGFFGTVDKLAFEIDPEKRKALEVNQQEFINGLREEDEGEVADDLENMIGASIEQADVPIEQEDDSES